jgi:hypothetical protein
MSNNYLSNQRYQGIIYVYEDSRHIVICKEDDICSAATVIDGFEFSVNTILQLP